tara:strand:- start:50 stop:487 length:438 start_codon:yes stop_codon:yes gene_type:complete
MNTDLIYLFVGEIAIILFLYKFVFRQMIVTHWEEKIAEDEWLIINLKPVIDEIEDRMHGKLEDFQHSFFGSVGQMVKKGKDLDPMNGIRKAAKDGDWTSMLVEYAANKAGIGGVIGNLSPKEGVKEPKTTPKPAIPKSIKDIFKL